MMQHLLFCVMTRDLTRRKSIAMTRRLNRTEIPSLFMPVFPLIKWLRKGNDARSDAILRLVRCNSWSISGNDRLSLKKPSHKKDSNCNCAMPNITRIFHHFWDTQNLSFSLALLQLTTVNRTVRWVRVQPLNSGFRGHLS